MQDMPERAVSHAAATVYTPTVACIHPLLRHNGSSSELSLYLILCTILRGKLKWVKEIPATDSLEMSPQLIV